MLLGRVLGMGLCGLRKRSVVLGRRGRGRGLLSLSSGGGSSSLLGVLLG